MYDLHSAAHVVFPLNVGVFVISVFNRIKVDDGKERDNCETEAVLNCVYNCVYLLILKRI